MLDISSRAFLLYERERGRERGDFLHFFKVAFAQKI